MWRITSIVFLCLLLTSCTVGIVKQESFAPTTPSSPLMLLDASGTVTASATEDLRVVYTSEGNLWIVEGEKPPRQLTFSSSDSDPLFSPDGRWILFQRELPPILLDLPRFELRVVGADGNGERRLAYISHISN
jgi:dipeptidyl aminopeptidase/acylaminoacyl peptidase